MHIYNIYIYSYEYNTRTIYKYYTDVHIYVYMVYIYSLFCEKKQLHTATYKKHEISLLIWNMCCMGTAHSLVSEYSFLYKPNLNIITRTLARKYVSSYIHWNGNKYLWINTRILYIYYIHIYLHTLYIHIQFIKCKSVL